MILKDRFDAVEAALERLRGAAEIVQLMRDEPAQQSIADTLDKLVRAIEGEIDYQIELEREQR